MGSSSVRRMLLLVVLVAIVLPGCGGGDDGAGDSVKDLVTSLSISDYSGAWDSLHPAQQRVVPKDLFIRCGVEGENANDPAIENLKVLSSKKVTKDIPWLGEVDAREVKVRFTQGENDREAFYDVVKQDGSWRWTLTERSLNAFEAGNCPS